MSYLLRILGNREDAEGIAQDVFVRALRFAPTYRHPSRFSTWLFTIARNLAINSARRRTRNPVRSYTKLNLDGIEFCDGRVGTRSIDEVEEQEDLRRMLKAMDGLSTEQKEVIVLRYFEDFTYAQMEKVLGTKAVTLRSRMFHGLRTLSSMMSDEQIDGGISSGESC